MEEAALGVDTQNLSGAFRRHGFPCTRTWRTEMDMVVMEMTQLVTLLAVCIGLVLVLRT